MPTPSVLLYADSAQNADQLYFGRVDVPDPFISFSAGKKKYAVLNALEFGRVKKESGFDVVLPLEALITKAKERFADRQVKTAEVIVLLSEQFRIKNFIVAYDFPAGLATRLAELGLALTITEGALFPEREIKTPAEAAQIREGNRCSAAGIAAAEAVLRESKIKGNKLIYRDAVLTSERLKVAIETACLEAGSISSNTIAAGGDQACDPHHRGTGPLRPNELIIVDVFPRVTKSGYHGDMTRTFLKGQASDAQHALVQAVRDAQKAALKTIRTGVNGQLVHQQCVEVFTSRGFETKHTPAGSVGFFHGTGHGLGLAVHEPPRMSSAVSYALKKGSVVTVEPGLYYPGLGGCRIEDVVQVTDARPKLLSSFHYEWEIK